MKGMFNKQMLRKKAMDMVMKGGPAIAIKISKKPMLGMGKSSKPVLDDSMSQFVKDDSAEEMRPKNDKEAQGLVQMEVSPEEQEMILAMRKDKEEPSQDDEMEVNPSKMMA